MITYICFNRNPLNHHIFVGFSEIGVVSDLLSPQAIYFLEEATALLGDLQLHSLDALTASIQSLSDGHVALLDF